MSGTLDAQLVDAFRSAASDRDEIEAFKDLAKQHPAAAAEAVQGSIPLFMERTRTRARRAHGVDIAAPDWKERFRQEPHALLEASLLLGAANNYSVYSRCQEKLDAYAADESLSSEERAAKVCEVGVEALRGIEAATQHYLQEVVGQTEGEAKAYAKNELALRQAGYLITQISLTKNKQLAKALDYLREGNKPANRERFETLLRELYVRAPEHWAEHHVTDWQLRVTRSAVVKEIESRRSSRTEEAELVAFAERETLLEKAREAGLTPRERELFRFLLDNPGAKNADAAHALGVAEGTVRSLKSRIKKALGAA